MVLALLLVGLFMLFVLNDIRGELVVAIAMLIGCVQHIMISSYFWAILYGAIAIWSWDIYKKHK